MEISVKCDMIIKTQPWRMKRENQEIDGLIIRKIDLFESDN